MIDKSSNKYSDKIVKAFLKNKIISPLPTKYTKKISSAQKFIIILKTIIWEQKNN